MNKCWAFTPVAGSRTAWIPCVHKAEKGTVFCRKHGEAIFGAMLGALVDAPALKEVVHLWDERERKNKESATAKL